MNNIDEMKNQLNNSEELPEEKEETEETSAVEDQEDQEEENNEGGEESEESEESDNNSQGAEGGEEFVMPEKFKGKSVEEVAKSYSELEKMHSQKMADLQKQIDDLKKNPPKENDKEDGEPEWDKMTPKEFAKKIIEESKKASQGAYHEANQTTSQVTEEIKEAKKAYPNLAKNKVYKETVVAILEAAAANGQVMKLKDACVKVEGLIGEKTKITDTEEKRLKQTRAQIETMGGNPSGGGSDDEESRIKQGLTRGSSGALGGLGI